MAKDTLQGGKDTLGGTGLSKKEVEDLIAASVAALIIDGGEA